jgi:CheY-like chemotaxis protein
MAFEFSKLKLLLVEDVAPMRQLLYTVLRSLGINNITEANNGEDAFKKFTKENHDIIITDWMMEPGDGLQLAHQIRRSAESPNKMVPIVMITGYSAWSRVETARDKGVTEFLIKPFTANDIAKRLAFVITNPRDFIETDTFFGPDRRRRVDPKFTGPYRRQDDEKKYSANGD